MIKAILKYLEGTVLVAAIFCSGAAGAAPVQFTLTGDYTAHWQMDVPPFGGTPSGWGFVVYEVPVAGTPRGVAEVFFYPEDGLGGLQIYDYYSGGRLLAAIGPQLYTGTETSPIFKTGSFDLTQFEGAGHYNLTITSVPEPGTYAMLLAGLGLVAAIARRRQRGV